MTDAVPTSDQVLAAMPPSALDQRMGIEVLQASPTQVVARMPVEGNTQPFGLLHGGASCVLAESVGSIAANVHGAPTHYAVGIEISCSHHRGARTGFVTATATPAKAGRQLATYNIEIVDDDGSPVATARLTCLLRPRATGEPSTAVARG